VVRDVITELFHLEFVAIDVAVDPEIPECADHRYDRNLRYFLGVWTGINIRNLNDLLCEWRLLNREVL
jgi:hypothetical protein